MYCTCTCHIQCSWKIWRELNLAVWLSIFTTAKSKTHHRIVQYRTEPSNLNPPIFLQRWFGATTKCNAANISSYTVIYRHLLFPLPIGTHNQNIQVYDLSTLEHECTLSGHIGIVTVLRVTESPYGVYMFSGSSDATVQVHDCRVHMYNVMVSTWSNIWDKIILPYMYLHHSDRN